jgi:hypothetical protein
MTPVYWVISVICAAIAVYDAYRRPESAWVTADRNRSWWVGTIAVLGLFGLGPLALVVYGVALVPRLSAADRQAPANPFRKR